MQIIKPEALHKYIFLPEDAIHLESDGDSVGLYLGDKALATFYADRPATVYVLSEGASASGKPACSKMISIGLSNPYLRECGGDGNPEMAENHFDLCLVEEGTSSWGHSFWVYSITKKSFTRVCRVRETGNLDFNSGVGDSRRAQGLPVDPGSYWWWTRKR